MEPKRTIQEQSCVQVGKDVSNQHKRGHRVKNNIQEIVNPKKKMHLNHLAAIPFFFFLKIDFLFICKVE